MSDSIAEFVIVVLSLTVAVARTEPSEFVAEAFVVEFLAISFVVLSTETKYSSVLKNASATAIELWRLLLLIIHMIWVVSISRLVKLLYSFL